MSERDAFQAEVVQVIETLNEGHRLSYDQAAVRLNAVQEMAYTLEGLGASDSVLSAVGSWLQRLERGVR